MISFCICALTGSILINILGLDDALVTNAWTCCLIKVLRRGFVAKNHFLMLSYTLSFNKIFLLSLRSVRIAKDFEKLAAAKSFLGQVIRMGGKMSGKLIFQSIFIQF